MRVKKKVLHVVEAFGGGIFTFLVDLINNTCEDYEIILAYSLRSQTPPNFKSYFNEGVEFIQLKSAGRELSVVQDIKFYREIRSLLSNYKPDIVHLHSSKAGFLGRLAINDKKIKVFYNPHGYSFLKEDEGKIKKLVYRFLEQVASLKCGTIVAVSQGEYEEASKLSKFATLINNGININKLPKLLSDNKSNTYTICTVGRISYQKNPSLYNKVAEMFPDVQFVWIGDGELKEELTSSNIRVTGWLEKERVLSELNRADVFLLTSLWEGLPIALLEAMYYKKICIVSNVIGNRDVINHGKNGFIASNSEEFSIIIRDILNDKIDIESIGNEARSDIETKYNFDIVSQSYNKLYEN